MNPYIVSTFGTWPHERYLFSIDRNVVDYRYSFLPIIPLFSPYYCEDNVYTKKTYFPVAGFNTPLIGLSSNTPFVYTPNNFELNVNLLDTTTFSWSPSAFRKRGYGNILGSILLQTSENNFFGVVAYPSQLFLYPKNIEIIPEFDVTTSQTNQITLSTLEGLSNFYTSIQEISASINETILDFPVVSSLNYVLTSFISYQTDDFELWNGTTINLDVPNLLNFTSSINIQTSSFSYYDRQSSLNIFVDENLYSSFLENLFLNPSYYFHFTETSNLTSIDYQTLVFNITSRSYVLQTSTVLLSSDYFQFIDPFYTENFKIQHSNFLSKKPENFIPFNSSNISHINYSLSGNITRGNNEIIKFTEDYNPIYYNNLLEKDGCKIRPDTSRLSYFINYIDYFSKNNDIRQLGDQYDDFRLEPDTSLEASYIIVQNENNKLLTFQLLQSAINPNKELEDVGNCVLSASLFYDKGVFIYNNSGEFDLSYSSQIFTPISGVPNTSLSLRYIADAPFITENESLMSSVCSISSPNSFPINLNTPISVSTHNNIVNWHTKYPPYYYSFKNSYKDTLSIFNYENINSLNFYLSSEVVKNVNVLTSQDFTDHYCEIDLYTSIYSDFDIIELPLSDYGYQDYIKYSLENKSETFNPEKIEAYILYADNKQTTNNGIIIENYDILNSPYIPAISGTYLRLKYALDTGGSVLTIKPSISTKVGHFDAFWSTTFFAGLDYFARSYVTPPLISVLNQNISSVVLSVAELTSEASSFGIDLRSSDISWNIVGENTENFRIKNITPVDIGSFQFLETNQNYPFDYTNTIEITGVTDQEFSVSLSSVFYNTINSVVIPSSYFNLYIENKIHIESNVIDRNNKIKILKVDCKAPILDKLYNVREEANLFWNWSYNNIEDITPVTAFLVPPNIIINSLEDFNEFNNLLNFEIYEENTTLIAETISSLHILIDTDYTLTEEIIPFNIFVELYDLGEILNGEKEIPINTYPDPSIFGTNFVVYYPNFQTVPILNTNEGLNSFTRPPNGTNYFAFVASNLNILNTSISSLKWIFETTVSPLSTLALPYYVNETITMVPNSSGFYDSLILKDLNSYIYQTNTYKNLEYINGLTSVVLTQTDVDLLCSYLNFDRLQSISSVLVSLTSIENLSPLATSLFVTTTSYYTSAFFTPNDYEFINELPNLYSFNFFTSSVSSEEILDDEIIVIEYTLYVVDFWLSGQNVFVSDDQVNIDDFVLENITLNSNVLDFYSTTNTTTSFEYILIEQKIEKNAYFETDVKIKAENVSILNWNNLYDFETIGKITIAAEVEFETNPTIFTVPKFIWIPKWRYNTLGDVWSKTTEKFVTILDGYDTTYQFILTGKTYGNRLSCQEYNMIVQGVQDYDILLNDPIEIIFAVGNSEIVVLDEQLIDSPEQYSLSGKDIYIREFKIPCYPDMYTLEGMTVYVTAFNRFFPSNGGVSYFGLNELSSTELSVFYYPITSQTYFKEYDNQGFLIGNYVNSNPKLYDYEPVMFRFYPEVINFDLDQKRTLKVKQIVEVNPVNSPNLIEYDKSTVVYELSSLYWTVSTVVPATSNEYIDLFELNVGDPFVPLTINDYEVGNLVLTASAIVSTKITEETFNNYTSSDYTGDRDLWGSVYQIVIGNEDKPIYEILTSKINTITTETGEISTYNALSTSNNYLLTI